MSKTVGGKPGVSRRDFLAGAGTGALIVGVGAVGTGLALGTRTTQPALLAIPTARPAPAAVSSTAGSEFGGAVGITTIAGPVEKRVTQIPPPPLYWQVETFPTLQAARAVEKETAMSVEAEGKGWLFTLGPQGARSPGSTLMTEIGPVPAPTASSYLLQLSYQTRQPKLIGTEHSHPGVESWYIVEGEETVRMPTLGIEPVARAGEGLVGPPADTTIQIMNTGSTVRKAFNMFVLDATRPAASEGADVATVDAAFKKAFQAQDLDTTMALFAEETVDLSPLGIFPSKDAIRTSLETFLKANPGLEINFDPSDFLPNTSVHRMMATSNPIRASGISRFVLVHTLVVSRGKIVSLAQTLDLADTETAQYALGLAPEGR